MERDLKMSFIYSSSLEHPPRFDLNLWFYLTWPSSDGYKIKNLQTQRPQASSPQAFILEQETFPLSCVIKSPRALGTAVLLPWQKWQPWIIMDNIIELILF